MQAYNVEIFDKQFKLLAHANIDDLSYSEDYLAAQINTIEIWENFIGVETSIQGRFGDYIVISKGEDIRFVGITTAVEKVEQRFKISYKSLVTMLDIEVIVDTSSQGVGSLERFVGGLIETQFVNNSDKLQNINGLELDILTVTNAWDFNFESVDEDKHVAVVNLYIDIIIPAFQKYNLVLLPSLDIANKKIKYTIAVNNDEPIMVETDLGNLVSKKISIKKNQASVNKLVVYSDEDYVTNVVYYLHQDGTFDTIDNSRIVPVIPKIAVVSVRETQEGVEESFEDRAELEANDVFKKSQHNHLIELECLKDDRLLDFKNMEIGQNARIIIEDNVYTTVLTGFTISDTYILRFGNIRTNLTKILRRGFYNVD